MISDGKKRLKKANGRTKDIINEVYACYKDSFQQCRNLCKELQGADEIETCRNIYDYAITNVTYNEDPDGVQWIKTPARLIKDGEGDCKSIAILVASCLTCLGIPARFRFVSFIPKSENVTHVYVVTESGIIIDPVEEMVNGGDKFNYASKFYYNIDLRTTNIYRLSGVGATEDPYKLWLDGTVFIENTLAQNYLLSEINCKLAYLNLYPNDLQLIKSCDIATVAYRLYNQTTGEPSAVEKAGYILQEMHDGGLFDECQQTDDQARADNLQELITYATTLLSQDVEERDGDLWQWWFENVVSYDYDNASAETKERYYNAIVETAGVAGIGDLTEADRNDLIQKVSDSGVGFSYLMMPNADEKKYASVYSQIKRKYTKESMLFTQWETDLAEVNIRGVENLILTGIANKTGTTALGFVRDIEKNKFGANVGIATEVILAIISAVVTLLTFLVDFIYRVCQNKKVIEANQIETVAPSAEDDMSLEEYQNAIDSMNNGGTTTGGSSDSDGNSGFSIKTLASGKTVALLGAGLLLSYLFMKAPANNQEQIKKKK